MKCDCCGVKEKFPMFDGKKQYTVILTKINGLTLCYRCNVKFEKKKKNDQQENLF